MSTHLTKDQQQNASGRRVFLKSLSLGVGGLAVGSLSSLAHAAEQSGTSAAPTDPADPGLFATMFSLRSMRRLKPDPIPEATLRKIIEAGVHAPSGGNRQEWGFILVRDPELKRFIRDRYLATQQEMASSQPPLNELPPDRQRARKAGLYLSEHMHEAPVLLLACMAKTYPAWKDHVRGSTATVHASIYPAVQNILLACRAHGIGATLTTTHCMFEEELKRKVGVPENMEISALLPLGFPKGKFGPTKRNPVDEVIFWDRWGNKKA